MARNPTQKLVITFPTTSSALSMEMACGEGKGRLIPIPQAVSAGCGLAWCALPQLEEELLGIMEGNGIRYRDKQVIPLY